MHYKVLLHRTDEGISVSVPGLPGCWSEGDTEAEALTTSVMRFSSIWLHSTINSMGLTSATSK
jgi:hypothetical protein